MIDFSLLYHNIKTTIKSDTKHPGSSGKNLKYQNSNRSRCQSHNYQILWFI